MYEQMVLEKKRKRRRILLPVAFLFHALSLVVMTTLLVRVDEFLYTRYNINLTLNYIPLDHLAEHDYLTLVIMLSVVLMVIYTVFFLFSAFARFNWVIRRITSLIIINVCSFLFAYFWWENNKHIDLSMFLGSTAQTNEMLTYNILSDNITGVLWFFVVIVSGSLFASFITFFNPRGWRFEEAEHKSELTFFSESSSFVPTRGNPDLLICPWYSEEVNMCKITDAYISPEDNHYTRYCKTGNCINCPDYR